METSADLNTIHNIKNWEGKCSLICATKRNISAFTTGFTEFHQVSFSKLTMHQQIKMAVNTIIHFVVVQ